MPVTLQLKLRPNKVVVHAWMAALIQLNALPDSSAAPTIPCAWTPLLMELGEKTAMLLLEMTVVRLILLLSQKLQKRTTASVLLENTNSVQQQTKDSDSTATISKDAQLNASTWEAATISSSTPMMVNVFGNRVKMAALMTEHVVATICFTRWIQLKVQICLLLYQTHQMTKDKDQMAQPILKLVSTNNAPPLTKDMDSTEAISKLASLNV